MVVDRQHVAVELQRLVGGLSTQPASSARIADAPARRQQSRARITDYHSVVTPTPRRRCASSPTTSIAAAAWIGGRAPNASPPCCATIDADVVALQEVVGAGPARRQPHRGDRRGARHGLGDGAGAAAARPPVRQRRAQPVSDHAVTSQHDLSWKTCEARCMQRVDVDRATATRCTSTTCTSAPRFSSAGIRRSGSPRSSRTGTSTGPKLVLGDFNEWMRGLTTTLLSAKLKSVDLRDYLQAAPDLSGPVPDPAPRSHLLRGRIWRSSASSCRARGCRSSRRIICRSSRTSASVLAYEVGSLTLTDSRDRCPR